MNNNEELDSQLSAMFDGELPAEQCELLARRLSRDEALKARWGRYAVIGAAIRAERGVRLDCRVAERVSAAIANEPALTPAAAAPVRDSDRRGHSHWWRPAAGIAVAVGVAAVALLWLRQQTPGELMVAQQQRPPAAAFEPAPVDDAAVAEDDVPDTYIVPMRTESRTEVRRILPPAELANYVVAHSEFSTPLGRRNLLSALMASEPGTAATADESETAFEEADDHAEGAQ